MEHSMPATINEYIAGCPVEVQPLLHSLRRTIAQAAPQATERISWGMATFAYHGNLVHFSAEKKHIGFHPAPSAIEAFGAELGGYARSKGTVRFPYDSPLPLELVTRMVAFRVQEQEQHAADKQAGKSTLQQQRPRYEMPDDVEKALSREGLQEAYAARPPYQRNGYIGWVTRAKQAVTREKRLLQMLRELQAGDVYMGQAYSTKRAEENTP